MDWEPAKGAAQPGADAPNAQPRKKLKKWPIVIAVIAVLVIALGISNCVRNAPEDLDWPSTGLATRLPDPPTDKGTVGTNSEDEFSATVEKCSSSQYASYVEACKEKGFGVDAESATTSYEAYDDEGYKLSLSYYESSEELSIRLSAPVEMTKIAWPTRGLGSLLPAPASGLGNISVDSSERFFAYIGGTDQEAFSKYVSACEDAGFTVDHSKGDGYYDADDKKGNSLHLAYEGFNIMSISVDAADDSSSSSSSSSSAAKSTSKSSSSSAKKSAGSVDPDFKAMMDEYEDFFDEYVSFMKKYQDGSLSTSAMGEYADMMSEYSSYMKKLEAVDEDSLSAADLAYYTKVNGRILDKLAEIGQ